MKAGVGINYNHILFILLIVNSVIILLKQKMHGNES